MRGAFSFAGLSATLILVSACTTTGDMIPIQPVAPSVDANLAVPCQEAAGDKYYMDPDRVIALSSTNDGKNNVVTLKADVRDAVCTLDAKGRVVSIVDTTPKSADQIAAEEAKAAGTADGAAPTAPEKGKPVKKPKKK